MLRELKANMSHFRANNKSIFLLLAGLILFTISCSDSTPKPEPIPKTPAATSANQNKPQTSKKKILFIDSYHQGYEWSDMILASIMKKFNLKLTKDHKIDNSASNIDFKIARMDTKCKNSEDHKQQIAQEIKALIESWKPDCIIASDDNASKYIIMPYFKNTDIPVVFCGLNFGGSPYGYPCKNITGMVEVDLFNKAINLLRRYSKGKRLGFLAPDVITSRKVAKYSQQQLNIKFDKLVLVKSFSEWKKAFKKLQSEVDILILQNHYGIPDYNRKDAKTFALQETKIPTFATLKWMSPVTLLCLSKVPQEQGRWAATAALKIINGTPPNQIPIAVNVEHFTYINMPLAKKLGIKLPAEIVEKANFVELTPEK